MIKMAATKFFFDYRQLFLTRLLILIKKGGLLQLKFGDVASALTFTCVAR